MKKICRIAAATCCCALLATLCLASFPLAARAETIIWNGAGDPGNTGQLRDDPFNPVWQSLFPDAPSGNTVLVNGDVPNGHVYGGWVLINAGAEAAETSGNSVTVSGGTIGQTVYGGYAYVNSGTGAATATNNSVFVSDGTIDWHVSGGYAMISSGSSTATNNSVTVSGGTIGWDVYGGYAWSNSGAATATGNNVFVSGGTIGKDVSGGYARSASGPGAATAAGNNVTVSGGTITGDVYGGYASSSSGPTTVTGNSVTVSGGDIGNNVYGGYAWVDSGTGAATVANNSVSVSGGDIGNNVYGGYAESDSGTATATGNSVTVSGGTIRWDVYGGSALSGSDPATATGNSVSVSGGTIDGIVYGGYAWVNSGTGEATATGNSVTVSGDTIGQAVYGGNVRVTSGTGAATAMGNSVTVSGGGISRVYGSYARSASGSSTATGNRVTVSGGTINGDVYGGFAYSLSGTPTATGNTVTLSGSPQFDAANSRIWGGYAEVGGVRSGDGFTGNTLNLRNYTGGAVKSVQNFANYNFLLPASVQNGDLVLTVTGDAYFDDSMSGAGTGVRSTVTGVNIMGGGTPLQAGESVTLMRYAALGNNAVAANGNSLIQGRKGMTLLYDWQLAQDANGLTATVAGTRAHPQAEALAEGRIAGMALVNQGGDLLAGYGIRAALGAGQGVGAFFAGQGGTVRHTTNSHVDVDGFSLMTGLAWNAQTDYGKLLLGAFFEAGWGNYDSHNAFSNYATVNGDGDTEYYGGGVLSRFEYPETGPGNIYAEASLRAGRTKTDFSSSDLRDPMGQKADYDSSSTYYGAHLGLGYVWNVTENSSLDFYTKYFWTHQTSDSVTVADDPVKFKSADSHRWRGGARFSHSHTTESGYVFTPYIGAAYEHEFDGKAEAATYGHSINAPDLKGGTGMAELGLSFRPASDAESGASSGFFVDLAVQGYTGEREGVTGSFQLKWEF